MKKLIQYALLFSIITLLLFSSESSNITINVITVFVLKILPMLAPVMILNNLFIYSGGSFSLLSKCNFNIKVKHRIAILIDVFLGILSGTPVLANMVNEDQNQTIDKEESQEILNNFTAPSLPFLIALAKISNWPLHIRYFVIFIPLSIEILIFSHFIFKHDCSLFKVNNENQGNENIVAKSILTTCKTLVLMLGSIILFSLFLIPLNVLKGEIKLFIQGIIEFSYPLSLLFSKDYINNYFYVITIISFASLSLILQVKLITPKIKAKKIIKRRLLITALSNIILFILISFLKPH